MPDLRSATPYWMRSLVRRALRPWQRARSKRATATDSAFAALVTDRKRWLFETLPLAAATYQYDIFTKESQRRLAHRLGVPVAESYLMNATLDEALDRAERIGLDRFVLKPNAASSAAGFRPLVRDGETYRDIRRGKVSTRAQLQRDLVREVAHLARPDEWNLEELLLPTDGSIRPIDDFKFYCLGGKVELIFHSWKLSRRPWKARNWYTRDWMPVTPSRKGPNKGPVRAPLRGPHLIETAEHLASSLCYPFIRVDLYDTTRGVVLGELTPGPGGRHDFTPEWDERLSRRWIEVADDVREGIRSGRIEPLSAESSAAAPANSVPSDGEEAVLDAASDLAEAVAERPQESISIGLVP